MDHAIAGFTMTGRRANNEDALFTSAELCVVADGMGGYEGGEVASRLTVSTMAEFLERNRRDPEGTWPIKPRRERSWNENVLDAAVVAAHRAILERRQGPLAQMGSTVVAALVSGSRLTVAHVGDSRCYRLRAGTLSAMTEDHSLWAELSKAGQVGERSDFPFRNQITRALGIADNFGVSVTTHEVLPGDRWLLCSDGLYDPLSDRALLDGLSLPIDRMAQLAFDAGGTDNITCVVLTF
jgi:serine/threonine protein phosphatase PrpC